MDELGLYKKMYATVVGQVDDVLQKIGEALVSGDYGREKLIEVGEKLKAALLEAEEMYLDAGEDEEEE